VQAVDHGWHSLTRPTAERYTRLTHAAAAGRAPDIERICRCPVTSRSEFPRLACLGRVPRCELPAFPVEARPRPGGTLPSRARDARSRLAAEHTATRSVLGAEPP